MTHYDTVPQWLQGQGVEIGAYKTPIPGIHPIYVDKFAEFAGEPCLADYFGESISLPFFDASLDFVASSHVLEHVANPVKALVEWHRVLKPGGIANIVVPDKRFTWDRDRPLTQVRHMLDDYHQDVTDADATHIDDFIYGIAWQEIHAGLTPEEEAAQRDDHSQHYKKRVARGEEINVHFHTFIPENIKELLQTVSDAPDIPISWTLEVIEERFPKTGPNGILAILKKKPNRSPLASLRHRIRKMRRPSYPLTPNARPFPQQ